MSGPEETVLASEGGGSGFLIRGEPDLNVIEFDPTLLEKWFEIPPAQKLEIEVPRVTLDMLYDAIHRGLQAQVDILGVLQNLAMGESYDVAGFNSNVLPSIVAGMNSMRRFQIAAMSQATGLRLDSSLKVITGDNPDGD